MRSARCACSRRSASWSSSGRRASTRPRPPSCTARCRRRRRRETHAVLPALALRRRQALRLLDHGQLPRSLRHASPATASCSTTSRRSAARPSSPARSPAALARDRARACRTGSTSATSTRGATGATPATTSRRMWLMLQQDEPDDYVHRDRRAALRARVRRARRREARHAHRVARRRASTRRACDAATGRDAWSRIDPRYFRPTEVDTLLGDPRKARDKLGWTPAVQLRRSWCTRWCDADLEHARARRHGAPRGLP